MSVAEILASVGKWTARHVVLTGGEPMVARGIRELAQGLRDRGMHITIETAGTVAPERVLLMPEGRTAEELRCRSEWLVGVCLRTGFRFCQRLHIELWGNRRGV